MIGTRRPSPGRRSGAWLALLLWWASPFAAQEVFEIIEVPVVNIDVVVTDRRDRPVLDLEQNDFLLFVDGEAHEVSFFSGPVVAGRPAAPPVVSSPAHLVLLFDNNSIEAQIRNGVIEHYRRELPVLLDDLVGAMVASMDRTGLEIHQDFTTEPDLVDAALISVSSMVARDRYVNDYEDLLADIQRLAGARDPTQRQLRMQAQTLVGRILAFSEEARQEGERTAASIWHLVEAMAGIPGHKAILLVGGAMSISPGETLFAALRQILERTGDVGGAQVAADLPAGIASGSSEEVESLATMASVYGVTMYSVIAGGGSQFGAAGVSADNLGNNDSSAMDTRDTWSPSFDFRNRTEARSSLDVLAAATGGFVHDSQRNLVAALERMFEDLAGGYSLGFYPPESADGQPHSIAIEVAGKHLRVRHRERFRFRSWDQESADRIRAGVLFGAVENPLAIEMEVRPPRSTADGTTRVPIAIQIPISNLAVEPIGNSHKGQVSIFSAYATKKLTAGPVGKTVLPMTIANDDLLGSMGRMGEFRLDLEVPPDVRQIAVGVRDDLDPTLSILSVGVPEDQIVHESGSPSDPGRSPETIGSPPAVRIPTAALILSGQSGGAIRVAIRPLLTPVRVDKWQGTLAVEIDREADRTDGKESAFEVFAYALSPAGETIAKVSRTVALTASVSGGRSAAGTDLSIPFELPSGRYQIRVLVRDRQNREFGVGGVEIDLPTSMTAPAKILASDSLASDSDSSSGESDALLAATGGAEEITRDEMVAGYLKVLDAFATGGEAEARAILRDMEVTATRSRPPGAAFDLARTEARVLANLVRGHWDRLLPFAVIYGEMIGDYERRGQAPLSEHAILLSTELAKRMAQKARDPDSKSEAAQLLTSLAGYLLYYQRLTTTEQLLGIAVGKDPKSTVALLAYAAIREQRGDYSGAIKTLESLLEIDPDSGEARLRLGVNLARVDQTSKALRHFQDLLSSATETWVSQVATQEAARLLVRREEIPQAVQILERAVAKWPDQPALRVQLAWLLDVSSAPAAAGAWVAGLTKNWSHAEDSARVRYHLWYTIGLEETRAWLTQRSQEKASILSQEMGLWRERPATP